MSNDTIEKQIQEVINKVRPYIQRDGGDIRYVKFEDGIVYVEMLGACVGCGFVDTTLTDGVEAILLEEVPGIIGVENVGQ
ncbi:MAG: NifU family protein [Candidatus Izemoplasma sp.]|nr:NifU family protein [Candidatus Izemoplasma sp.]